MFLVNSRLGLFTATIFRWYPFSRSYGVILPSSLTIVLSLTLGFSPHLPVSVYGTGTYGLASGFSWQCEISSFRYLTSLRVTPQPYDMRICLHISLNACTCSSNRTLCLSFCVPTLLKRPSVVQESLACYPSPTPFGLGLGPD